MYHFIKTSMLIVYWTIPQKYNNKDDIRAYLTDYNLYLEVLIQILLVYVFARITWIMKYHFSYIYKNHKGELISFFLSITFYMINNNLLEYYSLVLTHKLNEKIEHHGEEPTRLIDDVDMCKTN